MENYILFGKTVTFDDASGRSFDLWYAARQAAQTASAEFSEWYKSCGNIEAVLEGYEEAVTKLLAKFAFQPLYAQLTEYEIYDISQDAYWDRCIQYTNAASSEQKVEQRLVSILRQHNEEKQYRQNRKNSRGRWQGGGFGMSGALKGAAEAAALNAVSGLGHSAFNAIGNAGSALAASAEKSELYRSSDTQNTLRKGLVSDLADAFSRHTKLLNERSQYEIANSFDEDKSSALFENAKKLPEKRAELLVQAFTLCPYNASLAQYIFINFPDNRKTMWTAAQRFHVDLTGCMEPLLAREYTDAAKASEPEAKLAKERILRLMQEYGLQESTTLDQLETDCLQRLCNHYESADKPTCDRMIDSINQYPAQDKLKPDFIAKIQKRIDDIWNGELDQICQNCENADEAACGQMTEAVKHHEARDDLKGPYLKKIQNRVEAIWSAEDGEIFDNLYLNTNVHDPNSIAETVAYIQTKGRTAASKKYLEALEACDPKTIKKARLYKYSKRPMVYLVLGLLSIAISFVGAPVVGIPLAIVFLVMRWQLKNAWKVLTIDGKVIHPVLEEKAVPAAPASESEYPSDSGNAPEVEDISD